MADHIAWLKQRADGSLKKVDADMAAAALAQIEGLKRNCSGEHHYLSGELQETEAEKNAWKQRALNAESELAAAKRDAERLANALDPFVRFNSSEEKITLVVNTVYVRNARMAIADYALNRDAARTPSAAQDTKS